MLDQQIGAKLFFEGESYFFSYNEGDHTLSSLKEVYDFFRNTTSFNTIKFSEQGERWYVHFVERDIEVYRSKEALRRELSRESGGAWIEECGGKKRYFIEEKGWFFTSYKKVPREEWDQRVHSSSTIEKICGLSLGVLALSPGFAKVKENFSVNSGHLFAGLALAQSKNSLTTLLISTHFFGEVFAQNGTEFQVNTDIVDRQQNPDVTVINNDGFVVVWESVNPVDAFDVKAQRYDRGGNVIGGEFEIGTPLNVTRFNAQIAALTGGGFFVVWQANQGAGVGTGIYGQRYDSFGREAGVEFLVNTYDVHNQIVPDLAGLTSGGFVVAWESVQQDGDDFGIFAQKFDSSGLPIGQEFPVNTYTIGTQRNLNIGTLMGGGFVIVWESKGQDGGSNTTYGVFGQIYDSDGNPSGSEFLINTYQEGDQLAASVCGLGRGGFVVAWQGYDGTYTQIFGQKFQENGDPEGGEFQVNTLAHTGHSQPSVGCSKTRDHGFTVVWRNQIQDG